jgi:mannosyltransferase OCH1-like enzyme
MKFYKRFLPRLNHQPKLFVLPKIPKENRIPKIIHQTYPNSTLPEDLEENRKRFLSLNPSWEYRFYDDKAIVDFIRDNYNPEILGYYNRINPAYGAARADLFRYLVIYKCGGVYLDIKSTVSLPLDTVLKEDDVFLLSHWRNKKDEEYEGWGLHPEIVTSDGEFQQWHVIAAPGHPFLKAVIENILRNIDLYIPCLHGVGQHGVIRITGPIAYTTAITPLLRLHKHRIVDSETELGLKYSIYNKFSHMKIFNARHYTVLTEPVVMLSPFRQLLAEVILRLQKANDLFSGLTRKVAK